MEIKWYSIPNNSFEKFFMVTLPNMVKAEGYKFTKDGDFYKISKFGIFKKNIKKDNLLLFLLKEEVKLK